MNQGVTYALHDIYSHPECMDPVIRELKTTNLDAFSGAPHELPVLDSVLKESARLSAFECSMNPVLPQSSRLYYPSSAEADADDPYF